MKRQDVDMTSGSIFRHIVSFAFPLFVGNIFQQLYNTVDTWVVGNYASNEAYSAVGTVGPIINLLIGTFMGFASGAGVVISQYYGAGQYEKVKKTVNTAVAMTFIVGALFTLIGVFLTPYLLRLMKMPDTVFPEAKTYLTIYFSGLLSLVIYNMGAGILRAVGDSRRPFIFLVISSVINIVLDLLFVKTFGMGVAGVAMATVIAQTVSALLVLILLTRTDMCVKVN
ncbi:MAG: polysaccharide biosynthesis C-terminal domain-containing protein, partial [Clostridia bacterium]|nr:polysaccharide biosynthesis C-terminal domain-containing protein [Clostridia bacterium]